MCLPFLVGAEAWLCRRMSGLRCSGWNIDRDMDQLRLFVSTCAFWVWWKAFGCGGCVSDTLLGPEGSGVCLILMANEAHTVVCGCWLWALPGWRTAWLFL